MAKTRFAVPPGPAPFPSLIIGHVDWLTDQPFPEYHVIALWDAPWYNPWDLVLWATVDPDHPWPPILPTPTQLDLARALIRDTTLISDACTYCNSRYQHPWHIRWNIHRGGIYPYQIPSCAYDGSPGFEWTDDYWPPVFA